MADLINHPQHTSGPSTFGLQYRFANSFRYGEYYYDIYRCLNEGKEGTFFIVDNFGSYPYKTSDIDYLWPKSLANPNFSFGELIKQALEDFDPSISPNSR